MSEIDDILFKELAIQEGRLTTPELSDLPKDLMDARMAIEKPFLDLLNAVDNIESIKDDKKALENLLDLCKTASTYFDDCQLSAKTLSNSCYGYVGASFSRYYRKVVAADITAYGRTIEHMLDQRTTQYFESPRGWCAETDFWNYIKDEYSDIINCDGLKPISAPNGMTIYGDTDSLFFILKPVLVSLGVSDNADSYRCTQLCVDIIEKPVSTMHKKLLKRFADNTNCEDVHVFELEAVLRRTIHLAKKKYIGSYFWKDGKYLIKPNFDQDKDAWKSIKLKSTGVELAQKSTPKVIKDYLKKFVYLMLSSKNVSDEMYFKMAYAMTKQFENMHVDKYAKARAMGKFNNYYDINKDGEYYPIGRADKATRGAIWFNNEVKKNGLENKYPLVQQGSRIKFYETMDGQTFSYPIDDDCSFPTEFAPPPNVRFNLDKLLFKPLSRIMCKVTDADLSLLGSQSYQRKVSLFE